MRNPLFHAWPNPLPPTSTQPLGYPTIFGLAITGAALSAAIGANPPGPGKHVSECQGYLIPMSVPSGSNHYCLLYAPRTSSDTHNRTKQVQIRDEQCAHDNYEARMPGNTIPQINSADHH